MAPSSTTSLAARRRILTALLLGLLVICCAWYFWPRAAPIVTPAASLVLVVSGDTQGWLTPCGCTVNQSGGLPRRATYLDDLRRRYTVIYADAGGVIGGTSPYHALKMAAILKGELAMDVAAHNLGSSEIAFGPAIIRSVAAATGIPFISANTHDAAGAPLAEPIRIVQSAGLRIALAGVVSQRYQTAAVRINPPREAILQALASNQKKYDRLVILAYMPEDELESLARELPEADAIIGGPTGQSVAPHRIGPTLVASATNKGKFVAEIPLTPADSLAPHIIELDAAFKDAPAQLQNVAAYIKELASHDFPASMTGLALPSQNAGTVAGSQSCQPCHQQEHAAWTRSAHAAAWQSLTRRGLQVDPACQLCHTTVYGASNGFQSIATSPARVNVGCESCHGPSDAHVKNPKTHTPFLAAAQCVSCHDQENSPTFEFRTFWPRIAHGPLAAATIPAAKEKAP